MARASLLLLLLAFLLAPLLAACEAEPVEGARRVRAFCMLAMCGMRAAKRRAADATRVALRALLAPRHTAR